MKKICAAMLAACMIGSSAAFAASAPSDWAQGDVQAAVQAGFVPTSLQEDWQRPITRAEFCALAVQFMESRDYTFPVLETSPFQDTDDENVRKMYAAGLVSGTSSYEFSPLEPIRRDEAAVMLYRMTNTTALPTSFADQRVHYDFNDKDNIGSWAKEAIAFCYRNGVMSGVGENRFSPEEVYTVEQAAITMLRLQQYAQAQEPTPLTMTAEGVPMLYSNNPEVLDHRKYEHYGIYTAQTTMPNGEPIDAEYYHWSYMGSYQPLVVGVVVKNNGRRSVTVDINQFGAGIGGDPQTVSNACYTNFFASKGEDPVTVKPGENKLVVKNTLPGGQMINARVQLTAHGEDVTMKLVALKSEVASEYLEQLPRGIDDNAGRTAGRFNFSERRAAVDASTVQNFILCGNRPAQWSLNPGEYPQTRELTDPLAIRDTGTAPFNYFLNGNYATIYHLDFKNADGKKLYIRPNDPSVKEMGARYMIRTEQNGWQTIIASTAKPFEVPLQEGMTLDFLLLGGNFGNVGFHIA